jgi:hypothetical protein
MAPWLRLYSRSPPTFPSTATSCLSMKWMPCANRYESILACTPNQYLQAQRSPRSALQDRAHAQVAKRAHANTLYTPESSVPSRVEGSRTCNG